jgi:hypothetical protein
MRVYPLALLALATAVLSSACGRCENRVAFNKQSPDARLVATVYDHDCGALADYKVRVVMHAPEDTFDDGDVVFEAVNGQRVFVSWIGERQLRITCETCMYDEMPKQVDFYDDVRITYILPRTRPIPQAPTDPK